MWRIMMLTTLLYVLSTESRPMESIESPFWPHSFTSLSSNEFLLRNNAKLFQQQRNPYSYKMFSSDLDDDFYLPKTDKRALAMIARWGPFSNIGKQRSPIRSNFIDPENNINTQTRGRIVGQPLRWG